IFIQPQIEVSLKFVKRVEDFLSKDNCIKLFLYSAMEPFTDAIGLRRFSFCFRVVNIFQRKIEFIFMMLPGTTIFSSTISEYPEQINSVFFKEGQHPVIEHVCCYQSTFTIVQFCSGYFTVSVNKSLLVNAANTFDGANIISILGAQVAGMMSFNL